MIEKNSIPKNVKLEVGSALQIPEKLIDFDIVLFVMLIHHLVGKNVSENFKNLNKCIEQSKRLYQKMANL